MTVVCPFCRKNLAAELLLLRATMDDHLELAHRQTLYARLLNEVRRLGGDTALVAEATALLPN